MSVISENVKMLSLTVLVVSLAVYSTQGVLASAIVQSPGSARFGRKVSKPAPEAKYWFSL